MIAQKVQAADELKATLPSSYYFDPEIYHQEKERIFYSTWLCAGRADQVPEPGDYFLRTVGDESVIIVRDRANKINAFYNVCRHRGNRLCPQESGRFKAGALACRYHGWTYALDGKLMATPNMVDTRGFHKESFPLYSISVHLWEGFIFINLSSDPEPFAPDLGQIGAKLSHYNLPNLRIGHSSTYDIEANWKIVLENNVECYHCPGVHPELCQIVPGFGTGVIKQENPDGAVLIEGGNTFSLTAKSNRPLISTLREEDKGRFRSVTLYPNFFLAMLPDNVHFFTKWPLGPKKTRVIVDYLFEPSTIKSPGFDPSDIVDFMDLVLRQQDFDICEQVQKGVQSRAHKQGVYSPQEHLPYKFNQWVLDRLQA